MGWQSEKALYGANKPFYAVFSDAILQMWAAYMAALGEKELPFGCVKPEHTHLSHALIAAVLQPHEEQRAVTIVY